MRAKLFFEDLAAHEIVDANSSGHIAKPRVGIVREANKNMREVAENVAASPGFVDGSVAFARCGVTIVGDKRLEDNIQFYLTGKNFN